MIGQLLNCEVDLILAPLFITAERRELIDFTTPWLDLGITLLGPRPVPKQGGLFAFLDPFTDSMWLVIVLCWFVVSVAVAILDYIVDPSSTECQKIKSCESLGNFRLRTYKTAWHLYSVFMQQGPEGIHRLPSKIAMGSWFFFALIISSTYTANLAAFLTVQKIPDQLSTVDQLSQQTELVYGTVRASGVEVFFQNSTIETYKRMGKYMSATPSAMVENSTEGIERVRTGSYVFVWDSSIIEYESSLRPCNVTVVGKKFNDQGYGIAMPRGMPYLRELTIKILELRKEWIPKTVSEWTQSGECVVEDDGGNSDADEVGLQHMTGVFIVLGFSIGLAFLFAFCDRLVKASRRKDAAKSGHSTAIDIIADEHKDNDFPRGLISTPV
eukprot:m.177288 g.177288  ORF g.177288 m.177288 type:complete len:384 (+) comp39158_c2_seq36:7626-8777(+)